MDEGDDYVPQMSQLGGDFGSMSMPGMSAPTAQSYGGMSGGLQPMNNPYDQQMMLIGQQPPQPQPMPQAPPPKSKSRSKKKQEALDPMQSMAAMSSNPMMRPSMQQMTPSSMYPPQGQVGMYGQGAGAHPQQSPHFAQQAAAYHSQQYPPQQPGYPGINFPPQRAAYPQAPSVSAAPTPHANGYGGYPPQSGYNQGPQQYPRRPQYQPGPGPGPVAPGQQQMPPTHGQYWDQSYYNNPASSGQPMLQQSNSQPSQGQPPQDWLAQAQHSIYQIEMEMRTIQSQLQHLYQQPRSPMVDQEMSRFQHRYQMLQSEHHRLQMHISSQGGYGNNPAMSANQPSHMQQMPQSGSGGPNLQQSAAGPVGTPTQSMVSIQHQPPMPSAAPVQVTQSGAQVQVNIKPPEVGRTTINVIHQFGNDSASMSAQPPPMAVNGDDQKDSVPPEPTPTHMLLHQQSSQNLSNSSLQRQDSMHIHQPPIQSQPSLQQMPQTSYSGPIQSQQSYPSQAQVQHQQSINGVSQSHFSSTQHQSIPETVNEFPPSSSQSSAEFGGYPSQHMSYARPTTSNENGRVEVPVDNSVQAHPTQLPQEVEIKNECKNILSENSLQNAENPSSSTAEENVKSIKPDTPEKTAEPELDMQPTSQIKDPVEIPCSVYDNSNVATPPMMLTKPEELEPTQEQTTPEETAVSEEPQEESRKSPMDEDVPTPSTTTDMPETVSKSVEDEEEEPNNDESQSTLALVDYEGNDNRMDDDASTAQASSSTSPPNDTPRDVDEPEQSETGDLDVNEPSPSTSSQLVVDTPKEEIEESPKGDEKELTPSEVAESVGESSTEPSTPAPATVAAPAPKKSNKRPPVPRVNRKKKYYDSGDDDDDFVPEKKRSKKMPKKPPVPVPDDDDEKKSTTSKWAVDTGDDEIGEDSILTTDSQETVSDLPVVEKILNVKEEEGKDEIFLIKWKGKAYMHCEWKTLKELEELDKRVAGKIKRFKQKRGNMADDDEDFNPDYLIVDRIVDMTTGEDGQEYVLVKWKSLAYDEVTWEPVAEITKEYNEKIELWKQRQQIDKAKIKEKPRPASSEWKKMPEDILWKDGNSLREYQFEGVDWLLYCYYTEQNCILADEMGLGKTVQTITFLSQIYEYGIHGPFLIVVPLSTIHNWVREFETWTDMNAVVYHGSAAAREVLQQYEVYYSKQHSGGNKTWKKNMVKLDALITTFEMVVTDCEFLKKINWRVCVIDEAHRLKNRNCKLLTGGLYSFKMEHRVLLTGTPLQNNIEELFSLLNFLHPQQFSNSVEFLAEFGQCQTDEQVQRLQEILRPMMLRRLKEDVEKSLQPKQETIIEVQLSDTQKKYYRAILERNFTHLCKGASAPSLMNVMMELRKCCNHPFLIQGAEETIYSEMKMLHPEWDDETLQHQALIQSSGKVVLIEKLLPKLRKDGHKVLIFSQMVRVLDILEEFLQNMSYPYERIDGNVRGDIRQASIDRFSKKDSDRFVFLLCTRAGGLGINLTAADTVIIFDSDWNPQNDLQAQARCHRIGQTKTVKVYRLVTSNTYEREMFDKASLKLGLDRAVLQSTTALKESSTSLSKKDVEELLKKGAYGSIMDESNEGSKFSEEDIETILQRRTTTITLEPGQKGSLFSKATFNSTHNKGDDIDIDDPNFWVKWAEKAQVDVEKATASADGRELIIQEPRKRTKRFEDNSLKEGEHSDDSDESNGKGRKRGAGQQSGGRKRRRGEDDDGDYVNYRPDELAFNKSEYFKVEKQLASWGWGRWAQMKRAGDLEVSEMDILHMSRTLVLHCVREFRGDDRIRRSVWNLIIPHGAKAATVKGSIYNEGWAVLPEYNPPNFALDATFQRHIHRHANKLMIKIDQIAHLHKEIIGDKGEDIEAGKSYTEIDIPVPTLAEPLCEGWDIDCDKCILIGMYRYGFDGIEQIKSDEEMVFVKKNFDPFPVANELTQRFRRLILLNQRNILDPVYEKPKWNRREEQEFMRVLRSFGMKDKASDATAIDWDAFRAFSPHLVAKSDEDMQEYLYCVLAMCTKVQGGELTGLDLKRALSIDALPLKRAQKLMGRLHLTRKVHTLVSSGLDKHETTLKLCSTESMPTGWGVQHDKELLIVCDECGIDNISNSILNKPLFQKIIRPTEKTLLRRVIEVCTTLETGKWNGPGNVDSIEDSDSENRVVSSSSRNRSSTGRKRGGPSDDQKMRAMLQQSMLGLNEQTMAAAMLQGALLTPGLLTGASSSTANANAQAQLLASILAMAGAGATSSSSSSQQQQAAAAMTALMALAAASQQQQTSSSVSSVQTTSVDKPTTSSATVSASKPSTSASVVASSATASESKPSTAASSSSAPSSAAQMSAMAQMATAEAMAAQMGISVTDLLVLASLPADTRIPVRHIETKEYLTGEGMPKLKNLTEWLTKHPKYRVDLTGNGTSSASTSKATTSASAAVASTDSAPASAKPSAPPTPKPATPTPKAASKAPTPAATPKPAPSPKLEPGEVTKRTSSSGSQPSAGASATATVTASTSMDTPIAVFNRNTGAVLPVSQWPTLPQLPAWLEQHPEANVHSSCVNPTIVAIAGMTYADRLGNENLPSSSKTSERVPAANSITGASSSSALASSSVRASTSLSDAAKQTSNQMQEMMQLQLLLQLQQLQQMQAMIGGLNPYAMAGTSSTSKADDMNPLLMAQLMSNPLALQAMMMDPVTAAALAQMSAATSSSSSKKPKPPPSSS